MGKKLKKTTNLISKAKPLFFSTNLIIGTRAFAITYIVRLKKTDNKDKAQILQEYFKAPNIPASS